MKIRLPIGIESFEEVRTNDCCYIDKTGFIQELLEDTFKVNLITRPRRFGKTLTMSMLADFFSIHKDSKELFEGLEISHNTELCKEWRNQWPVLFLTLKDIDGDTFEDAYNMLQFSISSLCIEHSYLETSEQVSPIERKTFLRLINQEGTQTDVKTALVVLIRMMEKHYRKPVILLIDEYDVPLAKANDHGYYPQMLNIMRTFLGMAWKTNPSLKFAVITGCLRIAKESIFTGANNFVSNSVSTPRYSRYFGFTEQEVSLLLKTAGLLRQEEKSNILADIRHWYDGYLFGAQEVYCPWDVLNHVSILMTDPGAVPQSYWKDTRHNQIIRRFIDRKDLFVHDKFEILLSGGIIQEHIAEDLTYDFDHSSEDNLWSILYLTGYLTQASPKLLPARFSLEEGKKALRIPNEEIRTLFAETVAKWFTDTVTMLDRTEFFYAWWNGDAAKLTKEITDILFATISYFDYREDYYHAFTAGLFVGAGYEVASNSEQGTGRADILIKDRKNRRAIVIETKRSRTEASMQKDCLDALEQIERRQYAKSLLKGYTTILCYGAAFFEKQSLLMERNSLISSGRGAST